MLTLFFSKAFSYFFSFEKASSYSTVGINKKKSIIGIFIIFGVFYVIKRKNKNKIEIFYFPNDKKQNFDQITKKAKERKIPKIFLTDGFFPLNVRRVVVLADFDIIQKAFKDCLVYSSDSSLVYLGLNILDLNKESATVSQGQFGKSKVRF